MLCHVFQFHIVFVFRLKLCGLTTFYFHTTRPTIPWRILPVVGILTLAVVRFKRPFQGIRASFIKMGDFFERFSEIRLQAIISDIVEGCTSGCLTYSLSPLRDQYAYS